MKKLKKVLLTGANGQLGTALQKLYPHPELQGFKWLPITRKDLDLSKFDDLQGYLKKVAPDLIVNAAAFTNVDAAEDADEAFMINRMLPSILCLYCYDHDKHLIHISTDYVFGGKAKSSFVETDEHNPLNYYGTSKSQVDKVLMKNGEGYVHILRTSWLYGPRAWGKSFYKSIRDKALLGDPLKVVEDEVGSPTSTISLSKVIYRIIVEHFKGTPLPWGTYHCADEGSVSRYEFAKAIVALDPHTKEVPITPITSDELPPRAAARPKNSTLDCSKLKSYFPELVRPWKEGLNIVYSMDKKEYNHEV